MSHCSPSERSRLRSHCQTQPKPDIEHNMNIGDCVQWLFLDINAFFASCEQQETPTLRGKPIIVVQTLTDSACAIAASYPVKRLRITTGTLLRAARTACTW